ncbi:unnamed protein product [Diatraea saccharalis]|uniref:PAS domain-containing protein n=1 Tax=Diatraea saccharalis TaxID=40085 RepID=A0A9N9N3W6_9NEOP|nr:unnamed protein product [Diatraea saccharalis]
MSGRALLSILNGFQLTTTYRGLIVVVSQNVQQYLGYTELDLLGQNIFNLIHEDDRQLMRDMLMPKPHLLGPNGELLVPDEPEGKNKVAELLAHDKRRFIIRFKKLCQRSEPCQYATCHIEGSLRKSDRACHGYNRCCQMVRRARARGDNPCNSGNDVFVGIVRLATETFLTESNMECYRMEYRTRHSIDGQIIQSEQRISLVTGYMTHEVNGSFSPHCISFLVYDQHRLIGESCYRLLAKNGQFIYLKTRGRLDVDPSTRAVTSFVCTNTVVDEQEGKHLIKMMKKKFMLMVNNVEEPLPEEEVKDANDQNLSIEDPRQLEKVILHLVTNLPSPQPSDEGCGASSNCLPSSEHLAIIPPKKERIVSAIEKIYSVINHFPNEMENNHNLRPSKVEITDSSNVVPNAHFTTFHKSSTSHSPQLAIESKHSSKSTWSTENPCPKLPNFSNVYQHRNTDNNGSMDLNLTLNNTPMTTRGDTLPTEETSSSSFCPENSIIFSKEHDPLPGSKVSGVKRPIECSENTETEAIIKKKNASVNIGDGSPEQTVVSEISALDLLFDEDLFDMSFSQIDSTVNSMAHNLDLPFPDLLVSEEVQDILKDIEDKSNGNHNSKSGI